MNRLIELALHNKRTTLAALALILIAGLITFRDIPKESDPDVKIPIIYVALTLDGISPEDAERLLVRPFETQLRSIEGIKEMRADKNGGTDADAGERKARQLGVGTIILQAIATSIDALAVGVTFATGTLSIGVAATIIAVTTLAVCTVAWLIGRRFGHILGARAQLLGGVVLVIIAIKALL